MQNATMERFANAIASAARRLLAGTLMLGMSAALCSPAWAQNNDSDTTFTVIVKEKTSEHPFFNQGFPQGFAIDGTEGKALTLSRGTTYEFMMDEVPSFHPFYLTTSSVGQGADIYTQGVTSTNDDHDDRAWGSDTLTFRPDESTSNTLYYQCVNHQHMGNRINIVDATSTDAEDPESLPRTFHLHGNYPNPFNPSTKIRFDLPQTAEVRVEIYNMVGQKLMTVQGGTMAPGADRTLQINASHLPSGLYLYRVVATSAKQHVRTGQMVLIK